MGLPPFQRFLDAYRDDVYRFLVASVGTHDADDCFQETFLSALRAYPRAEAHNLPFGKDSFDAISRSFSYVYARLRDDSNLKGWVLTIANRKAIDVHRARTRFAGTEVPDRPAMPDRIDGEPALWGEVRALPAKQRAAVVHRYVNDLPYAEIGAVMGCTPDAARRSVHEGLKKLREVWQ